MGMGCEIAFLNQVLCSVWFRVNIFTLCETVPFKVNSFLLECKFGW